MLTTIVKYIPLFKPSYINYNIQIVRGPIA